MRAVEAEAAPVPRRDVPRVPEIKEDPRMAVSMAKVAPLEMRNAAEPEKEVAVAELEHKAALPKVTEVPQPEVPVLAEAVVR